MGLFRVGSPVGYASGCALYLRRTMPGTAKAANFPSPVAVQQRIFRLWRIAEMTSSCTRCRLSAHVGMIFFTMVCTVSRLIGSCHRAPVAIFVGSIHPRNISDQASRRIIFKCHSMSCRQWSRTGDTVPIQSIRRTLWPVINATKFWFRRTTEDGVTARNFRRNVRVCR